MRILSHFRAFLNTRIAESSYAPHRLCGVIWPFHELHFSIVQFFLFGEKFRQARDWFGRANLSNFESCPVCKFQGKAMFMNGHTRARAAY